MKSIFSSRRNKSPHKNEEAEKKEKPFFTKDSKSPFFDGSTNALQAKLTVGQPGDKYEQEADRMADAVVNNSASPEIQNKEISGIQRESLATPLEEEKMGTAEQRMEEDKLVQEKPEIQTQEAAEEEEGLVSKMDKEEEQEGMVSKMDEEPKEEEETEGAVQTKGSTPNQKASSSVSQKIKSKAGKGKQLPPNTQHEMEASLGVDLSGVNIHTDTEAVALNKELGAQAFTHEQDIYFNSGKYRPETSAGKHLLAHELTHVVQQKGAQLSKKGKTSEPSSSVSNWIQAMRCANRGRNVARAGAQGRNPIDERATRIIDYAQDSSIPIAERGVGIVTRIICNYFPQEAHKVHNIIFVGDDSGFTGLETSRRGRGQNATATLKVSPYFTTNTTRRRFARRVLQVLHELRHIDQYRQGLIGRRNRDQREFLAFCENALGREMAGTGRMQLSTRFGLVDAALGYYNCLSSELQEQYSGHQRRLLAKRSELASSSRLRESLRTSQPPTTCRRQ